MGIAEEFSHGQRRDYSVFDTGEEGGEGSRLACKIGPYPIYLPKRNDNTFPYKDKYANACNSIIRNSQKVETTQASIRW